MSSMAPSTGTVLALLFTLIGLVILLIFMYKKLNKESDGEYTIRRIVYKEGGLRDQVRGAASALETRLGIQLWPNSDSVDDSAEMQDFQDVEAQGSCRSDTEGEEDPEEGEEEEEDNNSISCGRDNTDDGSSLEESEENAKLMDEPKAHQEKVEETEDKQNTVKGAELLIDLNNFSGSAIWSEEQEGVDMGVTGTAL